MSAVAETLPEQSESVFFKNQKPIVVVGTGPVGIRFLRELLTQHKLFHPIIVYGEEPWRPYNRIQLSSLLSGDMSWDDIYYSTEIFKKFPVLAHYNSKVVNINRNEKYIVDEFGNKQFYQKLILATGSRPFIPSLPGMDLEGILSFRNLNDTEKLIARTTRSHHTVIIGGGLLGVETARAMQRFSTKVTIIEQNNRLLFHQVDDTAGEIFKKRLQKLGIQVLVNEHINSIRGDTRVESVILNSGKNIDCDTVIVSAGIKPNIDLAKKSGLSYGRGIKVNDYMQTSDKSIYAIGECCEHQGEIYGVVSPGYDQAKIAASALVSIKEKYRGSILATSLKVAGEAVFSMGDVNDSVYSCSSYVYRDDVSYRKINVYRGEIKGVIALGNWHEISKIREFVKKGKRIFLWNLLRFEESGSLWENSEGENVNYWPDSSIICSCNGVSRGQLSKYIDKGFQTVNAISEATSAGTNCGSCKPLIANMLGSMKLEPIKGHTTLFISSLAFIFISFLMFFLPSVPYTDTVQLGWRWDVLWTNSIYKQISGYSLLGISIVVLFLSLRKRIRWFRFGEFSSWRILHALLGGSAFVILLVHTGFRFGNNINFLLMMLFSGLIFIGAIIAAVTASEHKFNFSITREIKLYSFWLHILLFWPVPVLLGLHIFKTYYF